MVSTSGSTLLPQAATKAYLTDLLPCATILTPNLPEALLLAKLAGKDFGALQELTGEKRLEMALYLASNVDWVLLKGGHAPIERNGKKIVIDILVHGKESHEFVSDFSPSKNTHGTGCTLACTPLHLNPNNSCDRRKPRTGRQNGNSSRKSHRVRSRRNPSFLLPRKRKWSTKPSLPPTKPPFHTVPPISCLLTYIQWQILRIPPPSSPHQIHLA